MDFPWKGKKVTIFGLGLLGGGAGVAKFFAQNGAKVTVTDLKTKEELSPSIAKLKKYDIKYTLGGHKEEDFTNCDLIVKNPAIPNNSPYLAIGKKFKVPIVMESSLFFKLAKSKNIIGVTGTKGKTTTAILIYTMLKSANFPVQIAGNLQISMLAQLPHIKKNTFVVLELSSWQLAGLAPFKISPKIAVLTNIFPDHLNRYKSMEDYTADKEIIFKFQDRHDFLIANFDNQITANLAKKAKSQVVFFSLKKRAVWSENTRLVEFERKILDQVKLKGEHNLENLLAAASVGFALGLNIFEPKIWTTLANFSGVEHRLEFVAEIAGVRFYNDTTATTPEATLAGLKSLAGPVILICGGADKNLSYQKFGREVVKLARLVILLEGTATDKIERELGNKVVGRFSNFSEACEFAKKLARAGDNVLLSPAAASFGMFKNEFERGKQFKKIVNKLINSVSSIN